MKSIYKVNWSIKSQIFIDKVLDYLNHEWTDKQVKSFLFKIKNWENFVSIYPESYPKSKIKSNLRKAIISKHFSIIYKFENNEVFVVTMIDNRSSKKY